LITLESAILKTNQIFFHFLYLKVDSKLSQKINGFFFLKAKMCTFKKWF